MPSKPARLGTRHNPVMSSGECVALAALGIPSAIGLGWLFFRTLSDFWDALLEFLTSLAFRYSMGLDWAAVFNFVLFLAACVLVTAAEKSLIQHCWQMAVKP